MLTHLGGIIIWSIPTIFVALIIMALLYPVRFRNLKVRGLKTTACHEICILLFVSYTAFLLSATLNLETIWVCLFHGWPLPERVPVEGTLNISLFSGLHTVWDCIMLCGNILLFIPFGCFIALLWEKATWWVPTIWGVCLSFGIECIQLHIGRIFELEDIVLNVCGAFLGWLLIFFLRTSTRTSKIFHAVRLKQASQQTSI